ncbi:MAG: class I SAM-dependent methyltransferase [Candidatus Eremiobacteraeota bacterium]|nr:class I SAM-dependent methyltransferase [Candidatus Eremiobacteraeota bacterium]
MTGDRMLGEPPSESVKKCCSRLYESDLARLLLGDSFHPGGLRLTERLGGLLHLEQNSRVLDVACGPGSSAVFLTQRFGCEVVGVDFSAENVARASERAASAGVGSRVQFEQSDAESLSFLNESFDAVVCECAFCTFPGKAAASREFARVLRKGGQVGISDVTRGPDLPHDLDTALGWAACVADARPIEAYAQYLREAGLVVEHLEIHDDALMDLVNEVRAKLLGVEIAVGLKKLDLPNIDFRAAKELASSAVAAIQQGKLGYGVICATKRLFVDG